jgi:septum formation inhibitor MinC
MGFKMIEATKSTLAQASIAKASSEQSSSAKSFAANPSRVQEVSQAPYISPTVRVDVNMNIAILEFKEAETGDVLIQVPSEQQIRAYQTRKAREEAELELQLQQQQSTSSASVSSPSPSGASPSSEVQNVEPRVSETTIQNEVQAQLNVNGSGASEILVDSEA